MDRSHENPYFIERLKAFELKKRTLGELLNDLADTAYQGRALGEVYRIVVSMLKDPDNVVFLGLAGSMSTAGMWKIVKWFIEKRYVDVVVS
ncbi:MAG: deoxyhypusine synthase family protein, partial [Ignisphaera sp.]